MGYLEEGPTGICAYIVDLIFFYPSKLLSVSVCNLTISADELKIREGAI